MSKTINKNEIFFFFMTLSVNQKWDSFENYYFFIVGQNITNK